MELAALLDQMQEDGSLANITSNPAVQFGSANRRLLGAEILPERSVTVNEFTETQIKYRTIVANHGSRYSPSQIKNGKMVGHFRVVLSDSSIADTFSAAEYDALLMAIAPVSGPINASVPAMSAVAQLERWVDRGINLPLVELNEVMRWQAIIDRVVKLRGDNGYTEDVNYPSFPELSFNAADWTNDAVDPWTDINNMVNALTNRGVLVRRIITSRRVLSIMQKNALVRARTGHVVMSTTGQIRGTTGLSNLKQINEALSADGLPPIELYDLQYNTQTGGEYFMKRNVMVFIGATEFAETIDLGGGQFETLEGTLGYTAIGRGAGRATPGRFIRVESLEKLPPSIFAEGWQCSFPVIQAPEDIGVIKAIGG